jgi:hypothetical protein
LAIYGHILSLQSLLRRILKKMNGAKTLSYHESNKSGPMKETVSMQASRVHQRNLSPVPTHKTLYGTLIPAPERLTPTGQGRIKAPPVCVAPALMKQASGTLDLNILCFSPKEAEFCAERAFVLDGNHVSDHVEQSPLNIDKSLELSSKSSTESTSEIETCLPSTSEGNEANALSLSSSIFSLSSRGKVPRDDKTTAISSVVDPLLEAVSGNPSGILENDDLLSRRGDVTTKVEQGNLISGHRLLKPPRAVSLTTYTSSLKGNTSRQGRSLQRWLLHSPTGDLVREVAGTIPITRDGRIVLISASRKKEWILPKGGWDADETKEECAMRETYEEGGLLGELGGCLDPIDYQTAKSKRRSLEESETSGDTLANFMSCGENEKSRPPLPKRSKTEPSSSPTGPELILHSGKRIVSDDINCRSKASDANCATRTTPEVVPTPSDPTDYSYIRLSLFPLYVSSVKSDWPEKGRLRKLVDIDEAIRIMHEENRDYFRIGLEIIKQRGLHLMMNSEELVK